MAQRAPFSAKVVSKSKPSPIQICSNLAPNPPPSEVSETLKYLREHARIELPAARTMPQKTSAVSGALEVSRNGRTVATDSFFESPLVFALNAGNFKEFTRAKDAVMVIFYNQNHGFIENIKREFVAAACSTKRANHAYAAVNCRFNSRLCMDQHIGSLPSVSLFANGHMLDTIPDVLAVSAQDLRRYVEEAPVTRGAVATIPQCAKDMLKRFS